MLKAIWNGPFYIGRLTRPVSLGDAVMKILETAWRGGIVIIGLVAAAVVVGLVLESRKTQQMSAAIESTPISVRMSVRSCSAENPLLVSIQNKSSRRIERVSYSIFITDPMTGDNVAPHHFSYISTAAGILPGRARGECVSPFWTTYGAPTEFTKLDPEMTLSAKASYVEYE